jgi:hypothetical protein
MKDILDELTEIPFEVFWDKFQELKPGYYNRSRAEYRWFYMREQDRIKAFEELVRNHPIIQVVREPSDYLFHFNEKKQ